MSELVIDTREPYLRICDYLIDIPDTPQFYVDKREHKADFTIHTDNGVMGIQRKTCNDFVGSLDTLKDDLGELRSNYGLSMLLIEGKYRLAGSTIGLRRGNSVHQTVSTKVWHNFALAQARRGTIPWRTTQLRETCQALVHWSNYLEGPMPAPVDRLEGPEMVLRFFPGIGPTRAEAVVEHYGSAGAALVNVHDWEEVDGVGPKTREQVVEWLWGEG